VTPSDLKGYDLVYVPLHLEPEIALLQASPEFNNSLEMIVWISKSLPANCALVVKEQPISFGIRDLRFYQMLEKTANVFWARPDVHPWDWIKSSKIVATISGTTAYEAIYFGKPVISYGIHQAINLLPTVRVVSDYESTSGAVNDLLGLLENDIIFSKCSQWLANACEQTSFALPGFEDGWLPTVARKEMAEKAYVGLVEKINWSIQGRLSIGN
tara:strand:- start:145 stop:786 length:642 start_codon:yes stop_codon:yes gene_type:complete